MNQAGGVFLQEPALCQLHCFSDNDILNDLVDLHPDLLVAGFVVTVVWLKRFHERVAVHELHQLGHRAAV